MNSFSLLVLLFALSTLANSFDIVATADKMEKLEAELEEMELKKVRMYADMFGHIEQLKKYAHDESKNRKRRAICGRKLTQIALQVCESLERSPSTNIDLSPVCCTTTSCDEEFIKKAMCPDKLK